MNATSFWPEKDNLIRYHIRRNSLEIFHKLKSNSGIESHQNFRRSSTSFDKSKIKYESQLQNFSYQKQMDSNIYFNPQSRTNYFKKLIDSYFDNNQKKQTKAISNNTKTSYLIRTNILNKKKQTQDIVKETFQKNYNHTSHIQTKQTSKLVQPEKPQNPSEKIRQVLKNKAYHQQASNQQKNDQTTQYLQQDMLSLLKPTSDQATNKQVFLKKITQAIDDQDFDKQTQMGSRKDFLTSDAFIRIQNSSSRLEDHKILIYENNIFKLYRTKQNERKFRIKQFKIPILLKRHQRAVQLGANSFWKPYKFNELSLIVPYILPLKDLLYKLLPHPTSPEHYYIQPKPFYFRLAANGCQQMFLLFKQFVRDLLKTGKNIINNKINLSNMFYMNGKLCLADWEYSAFKEENKIQGNNFESRIQPILKFQNEWLVSPEYLAPQIHESIKDLNQNFDFWECDNSSDVYSIGLSFLEMVTLIPMWINFKTSMKASLMKPREGLLCTTNRSPVRILQKQKILVSRIVTILERQLESDNKNWKLFKILLRMIEPNREKRITLLQVQQQIQRVQ